MIHPKRIGLRTLPFPTIILEYVEGGSGKIRHRKIYVRELEDREAGAVGRQRGESVEKIVQDKVRDILMNHARHFHKVSREKIEDVLWKLVNLVIEPDDEADDDGITKAHKDAGGNSFDDDKFLADLESELDLDFEDLKPEANEDYSISNTLKSKRNENVKRFGLVQMNITTQQTSAQPIIVAQDQLVEKDPNKMEPEELEEYKKQLDALFNKNLKKPGDPGYEYNREREFEAIEDSGWDSD